MAILTHNITSRKQNFFLLHGQMDLITMMIGLKEIEVYSPPRPAGDESPLERTGDKHQYRLKSIYISTTRKQMHYNIFIQTFITGTSKIRKIYKNASLLRSFVQFSIDQ